MQTAYKRLSVIAGFGILLFLLILNASITHRQLRVQVRSQARVDRTRQVLYELSQTESLLKDAETGQRGYLYTGDSKYLAPYSAAIGQVPSHIDALAKLTADNAEEQANLAALRDLVQKKTGELARTISLYQSGQFDQAKQLVLSDVGLLYMDQIRLLVAQMQRNEIAVDSDRTARYQSSVRRTIASIYLTSLMAAAGLVLLAYYILHQIELREKHSQEMREREEWFRVTLTSIGDAVIATDREGIVTFFNPVAEAITGIPSANAKGHDILSVFRIFNEFSGQTAENPVRKVISLGQVVGLANHTVVKHADGHLVPIEDSAAPILDDRRQLIGVVLIFRDVTAERKSQEILRKTEKLTAAARLSASVAHEINNPLESVINLIFLSMNDPTTPPTVVRQLALAEQEIERVAHITRQTLGFYRESNAAELIKIDALVESVLRMYSNKIESSGIHIERNFGDCPPIQGIAGELKQVLSNVIANAIDAASPGGSIAITTQLVAEDGAGSNGSNGSAGGGSVEMIVADSGSGIATEHLERIFEPFFTTKKDVGTGLGLWVTKEIVERHGGSIRVSPRNGQNGMGGAAFTIQLPRTAQSADKAN
jgi:PAS domain S-box-containing protein